MKKILILAIVCVALIYFGWKLTDRGLSSPSDSTIAQSENLCKHGVKTVGVVDDSYTESTIKVIKGSSGMKMNKFTFTYAANGTLHHSTFTTNVVAKESEIDVWYDPNNPDNYVRYEPCAQLEAYKAKKHSVWNAIAGVPMLLIGLGLITTVLKSFIKQLTK
jgi:hypothetical protein